MPQFERSEYDAALAAAIDALPSCALAALGDGVIRVEQAPRPNGLRSRRGLRVIVYREPSIVRARNREELARFARADLVRAISWQLDLPDEHQASRALTDLAFAE
ncbi:MAG: hypothetical protein ABI317_00760 [Gaiellales bacterium]